MSAIIIEYWRRVTFEFSGKEGSTSGVFDVKVDSTGTPITEKTSCVWKNVSGDGVTYCVLNGTYNGIEFNTDVPAAGILSNFVSATENTTYTESDPTGTWSYVNANVEGFIIEVTINMTGEKGEQEWNAQLEILSKSSEWYANHYVSQTFDQETGIGTLTIIEDSTFPSDIFANWTAVTSVVLPDCFTSISDGAFADCIGLTDVTFPSTITDFGTLVFDGCTSLETIIMNTTTPPTIDGDNLGVEGVDVEVPAGSGKLYKNALGWADQNIIDPLTPVYGFNLDGMVDKDYIKQY